MDLKTNNRRGILLLNLGSPDDTSVPAVKRYLDEFLMDERVIDKSYLLRLLLVRGIITPLRAPKSAEAYREIWTDNGSPLVHTTIQVAKKLELLLDEPVSVAMRYGNPTAAAGFNSLLEKDPNLTEVIAIPMYPHYAMSSYETAVEEIKQTYLKNNYNFNLKFVDAYYNEEHYIAALAETMKPYTDTKFDHLLFSYHGIPGRHLKKTDVTHSHCLSVDNCCSIASPAHKFCYRHQCFVTTQKVTELLGIPKDKYSISFQSRLGKGWLQPFTDKRLEAMPKEGIKNLLVICPAFVSDCLETLEEIAMRGKEDFMENGGEEYRMIPCLNENDNWIHTLGELSKNESMQY